MLFKIHDIIRKDNLLLISNKLILKTKKIGLQAVLRMKNDE
jgi:hypothetical protein